MFLLQGYSEFLFEVEMPTKNHVYKFLMFVQVLQIFSAIPVIFKKHGKNLSEFEECMYFTFGVIILVGAAPWLIALYIIFFQLTDMYLLFLWIYLWS